MALPQCLYILLRREEMGLGVWAAPGVLGVAVQGRAGARREMLIYFPPSPKEQQDILGTPFVALR